MANTARCPGVCRRTPGSTYCFVCPRRPRAFSIVMGAYDPKVCNAFIVTKREETIYGIRPAVHVKTTSSLLSTVDREILLKYGKARILEYTQRLYDPGQSIPIVRLAVIEYVHYDAETQRITKLGEGEAYWDTTSPLGGILTIKLTSETLDTDGQELQDVFNYLLTNKEARDLF